MNPYCQISDLYSRFDQRTIAQLSNDNNSGISVNANIQNILDDAAAELESHIAGRYGLPLPNTLTRWVAAVAVQRLYARRADLPAGVAAEIDWADKWIDLLDMGKISLPNIGRANTPVLEMSDYYNGQSRFNNLPYFDPPALTGPCPQPPGGV
jgi:phage gp36-like protein